MKVLLDNENGLFEREINLNELRQKDIKNAIKFKIRNNVNLMIWYNKPAKNYSCTTDNYTFYFPTLKKVKSFIKNNIKIGE